MTAGPAIAIFAIAAIAIIVVDERKGTMKTETTKALYVRIPESLHERLHEAARSDWRKGSLARVVISALEAAHPAPTPKKKGAR